MDDLFPVLEPPPGGLQQLRERIEPPNRRPLWVPVTGGALVMACAALALWLRPAPAPPPVQALGSTALQLVSDSDQVVMVRVASVEPVTP